MLFDLLLASLAVFLFAHTTQENCTSSTPTSKQTHIFAVLQRDRRKMHLWPSMRIRDSFKISYLKKLEWNLQRMNSEKKQQTQETNQQRLLDGADGNNINQENAGVVDGEKQVGSKASKTVFICREILMLITCCYCCFCCGACVDEDEE